MPRAVILVTLTLLAAVIFFAYYQLRSRIREQIAGRDAQVLFAVWTKEQEHDWTPELGPVTDAADYLIPLLETNRFRELPTVRATRLFDGKGELIHVFPEEDVPDAALNALDFQILRQLEPVSHFHPEARAGDLSMFATANGSNQTFPLLEVLLPLHSAGQARLIGVAQFLLDGTSIAEEFAILDRNLAIQAIGVFLGVGTTLTFFLALAFRELQRTNELLVQRTQSLLQANQELALAAKTSAIGAVTAHLIHGLKNPLSGLQSFMAGRRTGPIDDGGVDWDVAVSTTRRMQSLISETVRVLREQDGVTEYELSLAETVELIATRIAALAEQRGVELCTHVEGEAQFNNRDANLIVLILENLLTNAIQATPSGKAVSLTIMKVHETIVCEVGDQGGGLPEPLKNSLFKPCPSTKEGGSGIGLAISKQLATSLGADLELKSSSAQGCVFALAVPLTLPLSASP